MANKPQYKLIYFNARGGGELSRLLFKYKGIEFTDERIEGDWQKRKGEMPLEALPVLVIDGKDTFCQSSAIARYLAREFELMGKCNKDTLRIEELGETLSEMFQREVMKIFREKEDAKKKEMITEFKDNAMRKYLTFVEDRLRQNGDGKGFYVGGSLTLADLQLFDAFTMLRGFFEKNGVPESEILKDKPLLQAHFDRVANVPNIKAWVETRPKTSM